MLPIYKVDIGLWLKCLRLFCMFDLHVSSVQGRNSLIGEGAALRYMCGVPQRRPFCETTVTPIRWTVHVITGAHICYGHERICGLGASASGIHSMGTSQISIPHLGCALLLEWLAIAFSLFAKTGSIDTLVQIAKYDRLIVHLLQKRVDLMQDNSELQLRVRTLEKQCEEYKRAQAEAQNGAPVHATWSKLKLGSTRKCISGWCIHLTWYTQYQSLVRASTMHKVICYNGGCTSSNTAIKL